jgi:hypothetical protein
LATGHEDAFIGICQQFNRTFAVYDRAKIIASFIADGMTEDEAEEFFEFNVQGAWVGEATPGFVSLMTLQEWRDTE